MTARQRLWVIWDTIRNWVHWHLPGRQASLREQAFLDVITGQDEPGPNYPW